MSKASYIIPIFVPHDGCPHDCVFCNQRKITGLDTSMTKEMVETIISEYKGTIGDKGNKHIEVAFFGGSFTGINIEKQRELLSVAKRYKDEGYLDDIRLSTRPDYIDEEVLDNLLEYDVSVIELGVQSLSQDVLDKSNRGHNRLDVCKASELIKNKGIKLGLQMMLGLPGDTRERSVETAKEIISLGPKFVRIYPTLVVKGTALEHQYMSGEYKPLELDETIETAAIIYRLFKKNSIDIIRVGLQPTDHIALGKDVVAGPFHPAFRQLVESRIIRDRIDEFLMNKEFDSIVVEIGSRKISELVGNKRCNYIYFDDKYPNKMIKLKANNDLKEDVILITKDMKSDILDIYGLD